MSAAEGVGRGNGASSTPHEVARPAARLRPAETTGDARHQVIEQHTPLFRVYPVRGSHRRLMVSPHNGP
jgi:hypothetical protein